MVIGHILLSPEFGPGAGLLLRLASALAKLRVRQHALVASQTLADRLETQVGMPVVRSASSAVEACCDLQECDLVHAHDVEAGKAALLLKLTSSQRYVLSHRPSIDRDRDAVLSSLHRRADCIVCCSELAADALRGQPDASEIRVVRGWRSCSAGDTDSERDLHAAREVVQIYRHALRSNDDSALAL